VSDGVSPRTPLPAPLFTQDAAGTFGGLSIALAVSPVTCWMFDQVR
jgi:hypothetical protein